MTGNFSQTTAYIWSLADLLRTAQESFYNTSPMDLSKLGSADIKSNLLTYVDSFSKDAREIFEHFKFSEFVSQLEDANLLFKVVQKVATTDLSPKARIAKGGGLPKLN